MAGYKSLQTLRRIGMGHTLIVAGAGAFSRYTKLKSTRPLLILEINYLHTVDPYIDLITLIPFTKKGVRPPDTRIVFFLTQLVHGMI